MVALKRLLLLALAGTLPGCAAIVTGTSQHVEVDTQPEGATCNVMRSGVTVATVTSTPGTVRVRKGTSDLAVSCVKPGYQMAQQLDSSGVQGWLFGNILIGGLVGTVVDFVTGAAYQYDSNVALALPAQPYGTTPYAGSARYGISAADSPTYQWGAPRPAPAAGSVTVIPASSPTGDVTYSWGRTAD